MIPSILVFYEKVMEVNISFIVYIIYINYSVTQQ